MWLFGCALLALIAGNILRKVGVVAARANAYGSAATLAGRRKSSLGNWLNIAGGAPFFEPGCRRASVSVVLHRESGSQDSRRRFLIAGPSPSENLNTGGLDL